ncbi:MAG: DUF2911 domain-containing protein [Leadbetterella sp.]
MKFLFLTKTLVLLAICGFAQIKTPASSPKATVGQNFGLTEVSVAYSRPSVKGRKIFGELVPFGKVWRTGANVITVISFKDDVLVGGKPLKAGSYGLYSVPNMNSITLIFNSDDKQWGAYDYKTEKDILRVDIPFETGKTLTEQLSFSFKTLTDTKIQMNLEWEYRSAKIEIEQTGVNEKILADIKTQTSQSNPSNDVLFTSAEYYLNQNLDLNQALTWSQKIIETEKEYWTYYLVAAIAGKLGKCDVAVNNANTSLEIAKKSGDDSYVLRNQKVLDSCAGKK